jgi:phenylalanyl-tRNA synthetase alpha chain
MAKIDLKLLKTKAQKEIGKTQNLKELNGVFNKYLGKRGELTLVLRSLRRLPKTKRVKIGKEANELKELLKIKFDQKAQEIKEKVRKEAEEKEWIDITRPGEKPVLGHLHPLTLVRRKVEEIFQAMGFSVVGGPEIETEWYNFDALNIPAEHPARDLWDTLWLRSNQNQKPLIAEQLQGAKRVVRKSKNQKLLLRTHTSPVQIRYMEKNNPPLRIIVPGNVFRHEATDPSHEFQLYQLEGLMVGKDISVANFKAVIQEFLRRFFDKKIRIRLKPDFFPFTEPSFDVGMSCLVCEGRGCQVCKETGWLEVAGAGMVHPNVFKACRLNPREWQGWAFGFGLDRLAMMKYKINDIRLFRSGDLRFLNQF